MPAMRSPGLILASRSPYRRLLLRRLRLPFKARAPQVVERARNGESPRQRALRLAADKALAVARSHPGSWVVGSDQVADCGGRVLDKPGTAARARSQLRQSSGRLVRYHTAVCLARHDRGVVARHVDVTRVYLRRLTEAEIRAYVDRDQPLDCAGALRVESLGVALIRRLESSDGTALIGLPLIWLSQALAKIGLSALRR
jgi:septum formation protein